MMKRTKKIFNLKKTMAVTMSAACLSTAFSTPVLAATELNSEVTLEEGQHLVYDDDVTINSYSNSLRLSDIEEGSVLINGDLRIELGDEECESSIGIYLYQYNLTSDNPNLIVTVDGDVKVDTYSINSEVLAPFFISEQDASAACGSININGTLELENHNDNAGLIYGLNGCIIGNSSFYGYINGDLIIWNGASYTNAIQLNTGLGGYSSTSVVGTVEAVGNGRVEALRSDLETEGGYQLFEIDGSVISMVGGPVPDSRGEEPLVANGISVYITELGSSDEESCVEINVAGDVVSLNESGIENIDELNTSINGIYVRGIAYDDPELSTGFGDIVTPSTVDISVGGNVSGDRGLYLQNLGNTDVNIFCAGIVYGQEAAIVADARSTDDLQIVVWKLENDSTDDSGLIALDLAEDHYGIETEYSYAEEDIADIVSSILYLIYGGQPEIDGAEIGLGSGTRTVENNDDTYYVASENETVYVKLNIPEGYNLLGAFSDAEQTNSLLEDTDGNYYFVMPRGGGVCLSMVLEGIPVLESEPEPEPEPVYTIADDMDNQCIQQILKNPDLDTFNLDFGINSNFTLSDIRALCEKYPDQYKICHFDHQGVKYVMVVPPLKDIQNYEGCLETFKAEPGSQAGFMRVAQIFNFILAYEEMEQAS